MLKVLANKTISGELPKNIVGATRDGWTRAKARNNRLGFVSDVTGIAIISVVTVVPVAATLLSLGILGVKSLAKAVTPRGSASFQESAVQTPAATVAAAPAVPASTPKAKRTVHFAPSPVPSEAPVSPSAESLVSASEVKAHFAAAPILTTAPPITPHRPAPPPPPSSSSGISRVARPLDGISFPEDLETTPNEVYALSQAAATPACKAALAQIRDPLKRFTTLLALTLALEKDLDRVPNLRGWRRRHYIPPEVTRIEVQPYKRPSSQR